MTRLGGDVKDCFREHNLLTEENDRMRRCLLWCFDRLSLDSGMNVKEQKYTMQQIGKVLLGEPSPASKYKAAEWSDSTKLEARRALEGKGT